ncbi:MAG: hypothetical protein L6R48_10645 [Planctomycetes bacterium]|nr:hypothetical protein [Planctomycetota bacterium]
MAASATLPSPSYGAFAHATDIGRPRRPGTTRHDPPSGTYLVRGSGYNIWFERDEFYFLHNPMRGDFRLTARFVFLGKGLHPRRKCGWMVRAGAAADAAHAAATVHADGLTVLQWRRDAGVAMRDPEDEIFASGRGHDQVQLERRGGRLIMRAARRGEPLAEVGAVVLPAIPDEVLAGVFVCAHHPDALEEACITNVSIERGA